MKKLAVVLLLCGCLKAPEVPPSLVGEAKRALAEREKRLTSFKLVVDSTEGPNRALQARHEVAFRSPNKSRAHVTSPTDLVITFDGVTLMRLFPAEKKYEVVRLDMPPAERAFLLASTFRPFVPEGYRAPLLPQVGVEARKVSRENATDAVELTVKPGDGVTVHYVLRMPAGDFLEKRTEAEGEERILWVEREKCDEALRLCVPTRLVEKIGELVIGTTEVTSFELNAALPQDYFAPPRTPEGWTAR